LPIVVRNIYKPEERLREPKGMISTLYGRWFTRKALKELKDRLGLRLNGLKNGLGRIS
jgi:hypothetical protein